MGNLPKFVQGKLEAVAEGKLIGLPTNANRTLWKDEDCRIDMQNMTEDKKHNLQVQVNSTPKHPSLKPYRGKTISMYHAPSGKEERPGKDTRQNLIQRLNFEGIYDRSKNGSGGGTEYSKQTKAAAGAKNLKAAAGATKSKAAAGTNDSKAATGANNTKAGAGTNNSKAANGANKSKAAKKKK